MTDGLAATSVCRSFMMAMRSPRACSACLWLGNIRPGADKLQRSAAFTTDDPESVLDPDIVPGSVTEPILEISTASLDEGSHFSRDPRGIVGMQTRKPKSPILQHLPGREAHDRVHILANEGAGVFARGLGRVDDPRRDGQQILEPLPRRVQFGGTFLHAPFQLVVRLLERLLFPLALAHVSDKADRAGLATFGVMEHGSRDQNRNAAAILRPRHAVKTGYRSAALPHLAKDLLCRSLAAVEHSNGLTNDLFGLIAE